LKNSRNDFSDAQAQFFHQNEDSVVSAGAEDKIYCVRSERASICLSGHFFLAFFLYVFAKISAKRDKKVDIGTFKNAICIECSEVNCKRNGCSWLDNTIKRAIHSTPKLTNLSLNVMECATNILRQLNGPKNSFRISLLAKFIWKSLIYTLMVSNTD
jgi:hypothetical protein